MPTYDYVCKNCENSFEKFQSITANPLRKCPDCKKLKLKRLIGTGSGIIFKGSGFYQTDYRSDSYKKAEEGDKKPAASSETKKKDPAKTEKKPETKTSPERKTK